MSNTATPHLLSRLAKAYIAKSTGINPAAWPLTSDEAWVSFAERLLRRHAKREVVNSK